GDAGALDQLAHAEGLGALLGQQLRGRPENVLVALAAALLHGNEPGNARRRTFHLSLACHPARPFKRPLTIQIREFIAFCKYDNYSYLESKSCVPSLRPCCGFRRSAAACSPGSISPSRPSL